MTSLDGIGSSRALPRVTAIVAAYNYEQYVGQALDSALNQNYPKELLDIIVVDDESTDRTPEILEEYRQRHPERITVIRQRNGGNKAAANTAVAAATGELLAMLDADDIWPVDKTRRQVELLMSDPSLALVYCDTRVINAEGKLLKESYWQSLNHKPQRGPEALAAITGYTGNIALNSTIMYRADFAEQIFPIPLRIPFQDWWITGNAAKLMAIDCVDGLHVGYRQHGRNGMLGNAGARQIKGICKTAEMRRQMLVHGAADHLHEIDELIDAWQAWEHLVRDAMARWQTGYLELWPCDDHERELSLHHARLADEAMRAGDTIAMLRERVSAVACDPWNADAREALNDLAWAIDVDPEPAPPSASLSELRRFVALAYLEDLLADPLLLPRYVAAVTESDDATLAVLAAGLSEELAVKTVTTVADRAGLSLDGLPDVVMLTQSDPALTAELEERADAVLTSKPFPEAAPAFRASGFERLRALRGADRGRTPQLTA